MVGVPLGNLGDITLRAAETLRQVGLVACEDTRRTIKLMNHLGAKARLLSCRAQNEAAAAAKVLAALDEGRNAAYCSDAGTPAMSDPGALLARRAAEAGHEVLPLPGPSAFAALVSVAGAQDKTVIFEGFLSPRAGRRRARLAELLGSGSAFVLYESPFRILNLLACLADIDSERYLCVGREMTKLHEEYLRGSVQEVNTLLTKSEKSSIIKGEFSVYVSGKKTATPKRGLQK
ncbi:MAG: 16S rRNA (cytidine(1402)-2'-O)-methyltransferase [Treponema sp.]|jgi:16S rRNA (cytidine1402-2'-O)-methyltransferase|nr:16S rRNA (cytidine(1402)-2'-O)-methyltransferase [Treponema sp.]